MTASLRQITDKMVPRIIVLVAVLCVAQGAVLRYDPDLFDWEVFKQVHVKNYITELEEALRKEIFYRNTKVIIRHNEEFAAGKHTYNMGVNKYTDLEHKEFVRLMNGYKGHARNVSKAASEGSTYLSPMFVKLPDSVDWRKKGAVTPVKDQGQCGSCWSFSTTGSLEGQHFRKTKKLVSLSEQNLVDCSAKYGNEGCNGGLMDQAFKYIKDNGGIDTEESYPYTAQQGDCMFKKSTIGANDTGFVDVTSGDEEKLAEAVATVGPVSIAIDASHQSFQFYKKGVYVEPECSTSQLDHGVLIVGYGSSKDGSDYWIVKNSWSTSWGDEGYVMMARNKDNQCGVATQASYPLV